MLRALCSIVVAALPLLSEAQSQSHNEEVPVIQGGAGPCSLDLTVVGADGKPVYAATVKVHIASMVLAECAGSTSKPEPTPMGR
jgi:hypothetical protein